MSMMMFGESSMENRDKGEFVVVIIFQWVVSFG
jgi:hypothetical protein